MKTLDRDHQETPAVLQGRAPILRCHLYIVLQHHGTTVGTENKTRLNLQTAGAQFKLHSFCMNYLWIGAAEFWVDVFKRLDWGQRQSVSDFSVTAKAKVSSSLNSHGNQICPGEPQRSVHKVYHSERSYQRNKY